MLLGATGFTGRLTADAMVRAGLAPVLAGRSAQSLVDLVAELAALAPVDAAPTWQHADVRVPASVRALIGSADDVLVSTVGPFTHLGRPAIEAAIDAGCGYVDSTGEPDVIRRVFAEDGPAARRTGARLLTAFGYDYVPGNLAGALALREAAERGRPAVRVAIGYFVTGALRISSGTRASLLAVAGDPGFAFRGGTVSEDAGRTASFDLGGRRVRGMSIGSSEHFALPRIEPHLMDVDVFLGWAGPWSGAVQAGRRALGLATRIPLARPVFASGLRLAAGGATGRGPSPAERAGSRSVAVARAFDAVGRELATVRVDGPTPYELTAELLAWAAAMLVTGRQTGPGALGPADAFGLAALERGCADMGLARRA